MYELTNDHINHSYFPGLKYKFKLYLQLLDLIVSVFWQRLRLSSGTEQITIWLLYRQCDLWAPFDAIDEIRFSNYFNNSNVCHSFYLNYKLIKFWKLNLLHTLNTPRNSFNFFIQKMFILNLTKHTRYTSNFNSQK